MGFKVGCVCVRESRYCFCGIAVRFLISTVPSPIAGSDSSLGSHRNQLLLEETQVDHSEV